MELASFAFWAHIWHRDPSKGFTSPPKAFFEKEFFCSFYGQISGVMSEMAEKWPKQKMCIKIEGIKIQG